jgi:hypothetical protein
MSIEISKEKFSLIKLLDYLRTEESSIVFCQERNLLPKRPFCKLQPAHGVLSVEKLGVNSFRVRCRKSHPRKKVFQACYLTKTWFERHKLPIKEILLLTYFFTQRLTYEQVMKEMERANLTTVSDETICDLFSYCREVIMKCLDVVFEEEGLLGKNNDEVQIDETKIGKRKYHRGRMVDGSWIFGAVETKSNRLRLAIIPENKRTSKNMLDLLSQFVDKDLFPN